MQWVLGSATPPEVPMPLCAICQHVQTSPREATGTVGLLTNEAAVIATAVEQLGRQGEDHHVMVHACPEHVVDVYRGRVPGVRMAWRLADELTTPSRRNPVATSASRA